MTAAPDPSAADVMEQFWMLLERVRRLTDALTVSGEILQYQVDRVTAAKASVIVDACVVFSARLGQIDAAAS